MHRSNNVFYFNEYASFTHSMKVSITFFYLLQRMADELNVPLQYFFCESDLSAELASVVDKMSDENKMALLEMEE